MGREAKVLIRLNEEVKEEFQSVADEFGISMSALGAYVIGNFLRQQRKILNPMMEAVNESIKGEVTSNFSDLIKKMEGLLESEGLNMETVFNKLNEGSRDK